MPWPIDLPLPLQKRASELGVRPEDIREQFVRGSGHGGQKVNKTSSTVQLLHVPTGIEVHSQQYREQSRNRIGAYKLLILKVEERVRGVESQLAQERFKIRKQKQRRNRRSKEKMLEEKHHRGDIKETRRPLPERGI